MRRSRDPILVSVAALLAGVALAMTPARSEAAAVIEKELTQKLAVQGAANFYVRMAAEVDLSAAYKMKDWNVRGRYVYEALVGVADASQAPVIQYAKKHGLAYKSFFTINAVYIKNGGLAQVQALAALPGVAELRLERTLQIPEPIVERASAPLAPEWGILDTKADEVWSTLAVRGAGIKVSSIDTGVQWNHPALVNQFACPGVPTDSKCWADPSNVCGGSACDNNGHGTHTMGTMVGDDGGANQIGMAPEAHWIACKGCESSSCSDTALNGCADWIVAPGGSAANRPHIVNNSWGGGGGDTWYLAKVNAWRAAGIFPAFSAGNSGSGCSSLGSPGDYQESFASAAHDVSRNIASFSSRGPGTFGHDPYTKPNISSPGVNIRSSVPTNSYSNYSGTSMASPHTAGAVALLWSGCPAYLGQIDQTFQALQNAADAAPAGSCGAPPDAQGNYTFGYGYMNILAAVEPCAAGDTGTLEGTVTDDSTDDPIEGATVLATPAVQGAGIQTSTGPDGTYSMNLVAGNYDVTASKAEYYSQTATGVAVATGQTTTQEFALVPLPPVVCLWCDDMESGSTAWTHGATSGSDDWALVTTQAHSPTHSWFSANVSTVSDKWLDTAAAHAIPAGVDAALLKFWHYYNLESTYDGAVLEISTDGSVWTDLGDKILTNGYTGAIGSSFGSPISGQQAWTGDSGGFIETTVDLTDWIGQSVFVRFRLATDSSVSDAGWWIDDVCLCTRGGPSTCFERAVNGSFEQVGARANEALSWTNNAYIGVYEGRRLNAAGRYFFKMLGDYNKSPNQVSQTVTLSGAPPKTLRLAMYKWSNAGTAGATAFKATLKVKYGDGTARSWTLNLPQGDSGGWRKVGTCLSPTKNYTSATMALVYTHTKGIVKFDNVSLEECSQPCSSATTPGFLEPETSPEAEAGSEERQ